MEINKLKITKLISVKSKNLFSRQIAMEKVKCLIAFSLIIIAKDKILVDVIHRIAY